MSHVHYLYAIVVIRLNESIKIDEIYAETVGSVLFYATIRIRPIKFRITPLR